MDGKREVKQEIIRVIYKYRSEYYKHQERLKHCRQRAKLLAKVGNAEQAEAYTVDIQTVKKIADFLQGEIRILSQFLDGIDRAA